MIVQMLESSYYQALYRLIAYQSFYQELDSINSLESFFRLL